MIKMTHAGQLKIYTALLAVILTAMLLMPETAFAAPGYEDVASSSDTASSKSVSKYGMVPIHADDIKDGKYTVTTESSSSFFRIADTKLTVKKGRMSAVILISSSSYKCVYPGTAEEAAKAPLRDYIMAEETDLGTTFEIPVEALNSEIRLAAFSKRKKKWYDRTLLIDASTLPAGAVGFDLPDYDRIESAIELYDKENGTETRMGSGEEAAEEGQTEEESGEAVPAAVDMKDGTYSIEVNMTGGSGRASVSSPTWLIVKGGKAYARLLWSSSYYDFMVVGGKKYLNESTGGGNSTFTIPVTHFDREMAVVGDTTSMGDPVAIDYRLTFYRDTIDSSSKIPQEAAKKVIVTAALIAVIGGILNYILKKRAEKKIYHKR